MENNAYRLVIIGLFVVSMLAGCGGGSSDSVDVPPGPVEPPKTFQFEVLVGQPEVDFDHCAGVDGVASEASFTHLQRITVYEDAAFLAETAEACANNERAEYSYKATLVPTIRKMDGDVVTTAVELVNRNSFGSIIPPLVRYPSGVHRHPQSNELFVLSYAAASSDRNYELNEQMVAQYTADNVWTYFVPGLFGFTADHAGYDDLRAGLRDHPPGHADGQGASARFSAPHDLEVDAAGLFYVIDDGRIRTIDQSFNVRTLDHEALGIDGQVKALDADHAGNIHVLVQRTGYGAYTWHRLGDDGFKRDFLLHQGEAQFGIMPATLATFTVVGDGIVLGERFVGTQGNNASRLYRVAASGEIKELTGSGQARTPQDYLDTPSDYRLPVIQHIEYGPDGHLYVVLPQGVLIARNFE